MKGIFSFADVFNDWFQNFILTLSSTMNAV